jgi:hypothetical protein
MERIRVWEGIRHTSRGYDDSSYVWVEFTGALLGSWTELVDEVRETRGVTYSIYTTAEDTIILHVHRWSRWSNESEYGTVVEYESLDAAARHYRRELENAGLIQRRVMTLDEWRAARKQEQE